MKDFDMSNKFFYCDVIAGITEFVFAIKKHQLKRSTKLTNVYDLERIQAFCKQFAHICPELTIVERYLLSEGLAVISLLEAQKFGNHEINLAFTKEIAWFNFTTRATTYGPAYIGHIKNMITLRPHELEIAQLLWTENHRK